MFLHIISFDVPYPANYGGVIVIFNQIKALQSLGVKVILHCFQYGDRGPQPDLAQYCHEVYYYKRNRTLFNQLSLTPFIMRSRQSSALLKRLRRDSYPILFEGMHTTSLITNKRLRHRQKIVRMHNVEWQYYDSLAQLTDPLKVKEKLYYFIESLKLQRIEPQIVLHADEIIAISTNDAAYYLQMKAATHYIPVFHPNTHVESGLGKGNEYVLFHGKLSVPDNERAAIWLVKEVFSRMDIPFIIAGMAPSENLQEIVAQYDHVTLVTDPEDKRMTELIRNAQINLLVSFQSAGMKLKLVNALFRGRHCIVNDHMVSGTGLESLCYVRNSAAAIRQTLEALINAPFEQSRIDERREILEKVYSNIENAKTLMQIFK